MPDGRGESAGDGDLSDLGAALAAEAKAASEETPGGAAEISAVRHALSEYGIANLILRSGDDPERVLVTRERIRA